MKVKHVLMIAAVLLAMFIVPVAADTQSQTTTVSYSSDAEFTIIYPANGVTLDTGSATGEAGIQMITIAPGSQVKLSISSEGDGFVLKHAFKPTEYVLPYQILAETTELQEGDLIITADAGISDEQKKTLSFSVDTAVLRAAGDYEDTLTFTAEYVGPAYVSTAAELTAALADENVELIILMADIYVTENTPLTIGTGKDVTLNLNSHTLSSTNSQTNTHNFFIDVNGGTLSVEDGTISYEHIGTNMGWSGAATVIDITAGGVLNLNGVTVENKGGTDMNFAVHLNNWGEVTMNANNCNFIAPYCGVRVFNSGPDMNNVKITNSKLTGNKMAFWVHNYDSTDLGTWYYTGGTNGAYNKELVDARLNLDIYGNNNTFTVTATENLYPSPIRYGFNSGVYYNTDGTVVTDNATSE